MVSGKSSCGRSAGCRGEVRRGGGGGDGEESFSLFFPIWTGKSGRRRLSYGAVVVPGWRNGRRSRLKICRKTPCGFESRSGYQLKINELRRIAATLPQSGNSATPARSAPPVSRYRQKSPHCRLRRDFRLRCAVIRVFNLPRSAGRFRRILSPCAGAGPTLQPSGSRSPRGKNPFRLRLTSRRGEKSRIAPEVLYTPLRGYKTRGD